MTLIIAIPVDRSLVVVADRRAIDLRRGEFRDNAEKIYQVNRHSILFSSGSPVFCDRAGNIMLDISAELVKVMASTITSLPLSHNAKVAVEKQINDSKCLGTGPNTVCTTHAFEWNSSKNSLVAEGYFTQLRKSKAILETFSIELAPMAKSHMILGENRHKLSCGLSPGGNVLKIPEFTQLLKGECLQVEQALKVGCDLIKTVHQENPNGSVGPTVRAVILSDTGVADLLSPGTNLI